MEASMTKSLGLVVLLASSIFLSCGGSNRQLQSISINSTANGQQFQFTAIGMFSAAPITVNRLPVNWSNGIFAPPPGTLQYSLTTQPFVFDCTSSGPAQVSVAAPKDPGAPLNGSLAFEQFVTAATAITCP
jgi:hypothetical protein